MHYKKHTSIVLPLEAVTMSPGLMPVPLIMFSQAATIKWTCGTGTVSKLVHPNIKATHTHNYLRELKYLYSRRLDLAQRFRCTKYRGRASHVPLHQLNTANWSNLDIVSTAEDKLINLRVRINSYRPLHIMNYHCGRQSILKMTK
jgi:hypothetical protein